MTPPTVTSSGLLLSSNTPGATPIALGSITVSGSSNFVRIEVISNGGDPTGWAVTLGGVTMTAVPHRPGGAGGCMFWAKGVSAGSTAAVLTSFDGGTVNSGYVLFDGVDQTTPYSNFTVGTVTATSNSPVTGTSAATGLMSDALFTKALFVSTNQTATLLFSDNTAFPQFAMGTSPGASGSVTMGYTVGSSGDDSYDVCILVNGISGGGTVGRLIGGTLTGGVLVGGLLLGT